MKRLFFFVLISVFLLCGCSKFSNTKNNISTYFPFYKNKTYVYKTIDSGSGEIISIDNQFPLYVDNDAMQLITESVTQNTKEKEIDIYSQIWSNQGSDLVCISTKHLSPLVNIENIDVESIMAEPRYKIFSEPLKVTDPNSSEEISIITGVDLKITTPYKTFDSVMELTDRTYRDYERKIYFAPNVGIIKDIVFYDSYWEDNKPRTFSTELSNIIENSSFDIERTLYTVDYNAEKLLESNFTIKLSTNDNLNDKILDVMKKNKLVTNSAKINKLKFEYGETDILHIDFNKGFIDLSKLGASNESLTLQAIANTFARVYDHEEVFKIKKVDITVDGKKYESGHISFKDGEFLDVK